MKIYFNCFMFSIFTKIVNMLHSHLVSVIIPCFNQGRFLSETINSVLQSNYPSIELIIINDGSTDNTEQIGLSLENKHENVIYISQSNSGPSIARNKGIEKASGKFILPLDADDLISSNYIAEAIKVLDSKPEVKVVYCKAEKFGAKNGPWKLKPFSRLNLATDNMIFVSGIYRKTDWKTIGGYADEMTWGYEDWEFWISMLKFEGEVVQLPFVGFHYRISPTSRRKSVKREGKRKTIEFLNFKHKDFLHKYLGGPLRSSRTHSKKINTLYNFLNKLLH